MSHISPISLTTLCICNATIGDVISIELEQLGMCALFPPQANHPPPPSLLLDS